MEFKLLNFLANGLLNLTWLQIVMATLAMTHVTIISVTVYLHRSQAHRALDVHPWVAHFFRFWLWITTSVSTKEWVSVHRKHHAKCETEQDPHSPKIKGLLNVLTHGAELYKLEAKNKETIERYSQGTPNDWVETHIYSNPKRKNLGIAAMLLIDIAMFGAIGITVWAIQMIWIPFWAAGVINGLGHYFGYRNFECSDAATNLGPWGILVGGEELHNNHHTYPTSAKLSVKPHEIDIGWGYIKALEFLGLAKVKKIAPVAVSGSQRAVADEDLLHTINRHRFELMAQFSKALQSTCKTEFKSASFKTNSPSSQKAEEISAMKVAHKERSRIPERLHQAVEKIEKQSSKIRKMVKMREDLKTLWTSTQVSNEHLIKHLNQWCHEAENSGIASLKNFSVKMRSMRTR